MLRHLQIHLKPMPDLAFAKIHTAAMNLVIGKFKKALDRRLEGKDVLGVVFDNQMTRIFSDGEWGLTGGTIRYPTSCGPEFDIVVDQFVRGLPGIDRDASS